MGVLGVVCGVTRYRYLGSGGFGAVVQAKHKLDGNSYAVKKISLKQSQAELGQKVLREVTTLAPLDHANVIRYNAAWIEYGPAPTSPQGAAPHGSSRGMWSDGGGVASSGPGSSVGGYSLSSAASDSGVNRSDDIAGTTSSSPGCGSGGIRTSSDVSNASTASSNFEWSAVGVTTRTSVGHTGASSVSVASSASSPSASMTESLGNSYVSGGGGGSNSQGRSFRHQVRG